MTNEEIEWYEENWHNGQTRFNKNRAQATDSRSYKLGVNVWDLPYEGGESPHYWMDRRCWKSNRKTHYKIPKIKKYKKRKSAEKEHWRYKKPYHSWSWKNTQWRKTRKELAAKRKQNEEQMRLHIKELKDTGKWVYGWRYGAFYDDYTDKWCSYRIDRNDPFAEKHFFWE